MKIRIEVYDDWCRLLVNDKLATEGHTRDYLYDDLLDLMRLQGIEVETETFEGAEHGEAGAFAVGPYYGEAGA